ncbi:MAG: hypothetical protein P8188_07290 [Gemmatimonadota bacterium]
MTDPQATEESLPVGPAGNREWLRAAALLFAILVLWDSAALVVVPFMILLSVLPVRRPAAFVVAGLGALLIFGFQSRDSGLWYMELAWTVLVGGWFAALTLRRPDARLLHRGLAAVGASVVVVAAAFLARPGWWGVVDWSVRDELTTGAVQALGILREVQGSEGLPPGFSDTVYGMAEAQANLFPAFLGLATLAGLAVAWWLYARLSLAQDGALAPLRELRFDDQLIWVFIGGLLLVVLTAGEGWTRIGSNTLVFMGVLYVLRGAAVVLFVNGGLSWIGGIVLALAMLLVAPVILGATLLIGLGDTWLDIREKVRTSVG